MPARARRLSIEALARLIAWRGAAVEQWPAGRLLRLARWIAEPPPFGWVPGWYFGLGDSSADPVVRLRKRLWQYFASTEDEYAFAIPWYCGLRIWLYLGNDQSWAMFVGKGFEPNEFAFLSTTLKPGMTVIDVGANEGLYTAFAARCVGPKGKVIAVEPSSRECGRLRRNLELNHLQNVVIFPVAASNASGQADLRIAGYGHEGHNTLGAFIYGTRLARTETVRLLPLDDVAREAGVERVDVMKIDVEGAELAALEGARGILSRDHPLLLLELCDATLQHQGAGSADVLKLLKAYGYHVFIFDPTSGRPAAGETPPEEDQNVIAVHPSHPISMPELRPALVRAGHAAPGVRT
jgi:FkbM family methyltransferase